MSGLAQLRTVTDSRISHEANPLADSEEAGAWRAVSQLLHDMKNRVANLESSAAGMRRSVADAEANANKLRSLVKALFKSNGGETAPLQISEPFSIEPGRSTTARNFTLGDFTICIVTVEPDSNEENEENRS